MINEYVRIKMIIKFLSTKTLESSLFLELAECLNSRKITSSFKVGVQAPELQPIIFIEKTYRFDILNNRSNLTMGTHIKT